MKPETASRIVGFFLSAPVVVAAFTALGAIVGASSPVHAQAVVGPLAAPGPDIPSWLAPFFGIIVGAVITGTLAMATWFLRTFFGVSIAALSAMMIAAADIVEARAKKTKEVSDDAPASAIAAALKEGARVLRQAEKTIPLGKKDGVE